MAEQNYIEEFISAIKQEPDKRDNSFSAEVSRIDDKGKVWVRIAGSEKETPTSTTSSEVKPGDAVNVEWRNSRIYIIGNTSNPSAGAIRVTAVEQAARQAKNSADQAARAAETAMQDAGIAHEAARTARIDAERALSEANSAEESAAAAHMAADNALVQLGTVEDVIGVLTWLEDHGSYKKSLDEEVVLGKHYFTIIGGTGTEADPYRFDLVTDPVGSPVENDYYEIDSIREAVTSYILAHLTLTSQGLWIQGEESHGKGLFSPSGIDLYHPLKGLISHFGETIKLGDARTYLEITSALLEFFLNSRSMGKFGYSDIFESYGVEVENVMIKGAGNALRLDNNVNGTYQGQYILETRANGHLSLKPGLSRTDEEV